MILFPEKFKCSNSLRQLIKSKKFEVKVDTCFEQVIRACSLVERKDQSGTWLSAKMITAYIDLHQQGFAHSVEVFAQGNLVGGLYGISIGQAFFGESMFHYQSNASKVALYYLVELANKFRFHFIDVQQSTSHLRSMGAEDIPREIFLKRLQVAVSDSTINTKWTREF
jgi:leucyl/phenylalanyl-tRNA--protein transferase